MPFFTSAGASRARAVLVALGTLAGAAACTATVDPIGGGPSGAGGHDSQATSVSTTTLGGGGDGGAGLGGFGAGGASTAVGGGSATSVALFRSELPDGGTGGSSVAVGTGAGGSSADGGGGPIGEDLLLFVSNVGTSCADPFSDGGCVDSGVRATITLTPAVQAVGTYLLGDPAVSAVFSEWSPGGAECMGSGGSFVDGSITITAIDGTSIAIELAGTDAPALDGAHTILRCHPLVEDTYAVLAYYPSDLPGGAGGAGSVATSVGTGGSGHGGEDLILDFGDHDQLCSDPSATPPPGVTYEDLLLYLPPSYVAPGTYALDDPAIGISYYQTSENTGAVGGGPGSETGTLTIFQVTDTFIDLQLEGTSHDFANGAGQVPRCGG